jgi:DinB superfamily
VTELERAREQIAFSRAYTVRLIDSIEPADWFRMPSAGVSHIAWQVGHLTYAQYRLVLVRLRGQLLSDKELIPEEFVKSFSARSTPDADPAHYPRPDEIRTVMDCVHKRALDDLSTCDPARLAAPNDPPHPLAKTKLESLFWCAAHEMLHAGQIGLLRRQLGHQPMW